MSANKGGRGRATPIEVRAREGNPSGRPLPEPVIVGGRIIDETDIPDPPDHLADDDQAVELWRVAAGILADARILTEGDMLNLEGFVEAVMLAREAYRHLKPGGDVDTKGAVLEALNDRGGRPSLVRSPWLSVWKDARATAIKHAGEFGLTPSARARLGLALLAGRRMKDELERDLPANPRGDK